MKGDIQHTSSQHITMLPFFTVVLCQNNMGLLGVEGWYDSGQAFSILRGRGPGGSSGRPGSGSGQSQPADSWPRYSSNVTSASWLCVQAVHQHGMLDLILVFSFLPQIILTPSCSPPARRGVVCFDKLFPFQFTFFAWVWWCRAAWFFWRLCFACVFHFGTIKCERSFVFVMQRIQQMMGKQWDGIFTDVEPLELKVGTAVLRLLVWVIGRQES